MKKGDIHFQSAIPIQVQKEYPQDEVSKNAQLLIRAGYINKHMAGVYEFLPFGLRSLEKIISIIREEMNAIDCYEILMSSLQRSDIWKQTDRFDLDDVWLRTKLHVGDDIGLGWTHEEPITDCMRRHIHSYKDIPAGLYQFQTKFRNEERAKSGVLRTREFIMKDLYTFCTDETQHKEFYERCAEAYTTIFNRVGIGEKTYRTFASGGAFSEFSDEFQTICDAGEDTIFIEPKRQLSFNKEVCVPEVLEKFSVNKSDLEEHPACEVGNIFTLGTRFSETLDLLYADKDGTRKPVFMGSYGIGPARLFGVIVELFGKKDGMVLPRVVSPYDMHVLVLEHDDSTCMQTARELADVCSQNELSVLIDDREDSAGEKFADADFIGMQDRVIISKRSIESGGVEYKNMKTDGTSVVPVSNFLAMYNNSKE